MFARTLAAAPLVVLASALVLDVPLRAQGSRNVALLANLVPVAERFSGLWGWVDPTSGKEFALIGSTEGTHVIDCSDPRNPVERGLIPTDNPGPSTNRWREIRAFGRYAYVVSEAHGGVQIIDLTNPAQPVKVKSWGTSLWINAHNIGIDQDAGIAYVCGTNTGMHVLDVKTNPTEPVPLAVYTTGYVHDVMPQHGRAHLSEISSNRYTVLDVSALPALATLVSIPSAGLSACHSAWPSRRDDIVAICHETPGGELVVYDITNVRLPALRSKYQIGGASAIIHNPMLVDSVCHLAWNTEGYQAVDLSDPANPVNVGHYDTWSGASSGFNGLWGIFAVQPSGAVYGSDRTRGLFVFAPKCALRRYGAATPGAFTPELHTLGAAWLGNARFRLEAAAANPASAGAIALGTAPASVAVQGVQLLVDFGQPYALLPLAIDGAGEGSVPLPVPAALPPATLYAQVFVLDAAAPLGISASRGGEVDVFAR